jgi:DNA sulfur modification protein DndE
MSIEYVRVSEQAKDQLITLKRRTGITQWNVLCRWAFCASLAEPHVPPDGRISADSNVEMSWKVFGGVHHEVYFAVLKQRCHKDGLGTDSETLARQFRNHLHRGIGYLFGDRQIKDISSLVTKGLGPYG